MTDIPIDGTTKHVTIRADEQGGRYRLLAQFPGGETEELASEPVPPLGNQGLFVWTSDWHIGRGTSNPARIDSVVDRLLLLQPAGVIDTGDCKDGFGAGTGTQLDDYVTRVRYRVPWAVSKGAPLPILPGNHDEVFDYTPQGNPTDFSLWAPRMWAAPYHWSTDWAAPKIRFLAIHSTIKHENPFWGFASVAAAETDWLGNELAALPAGWKAIVCSHFPANPAFGNEIRPELGGTALRTILSANSAKIVAYLNGHRHANMSVSNMNNIPHFNGPSVSYTLGNGYGAYATITYDPEGGSVTLRVYYAVAPFNEYPVSLYSPVTIGL